MYLTYCFGVTPFKVENTEKCIVKEVGGEKEVYLPCCYTKVTEETVDEIKRQLEHLLEVAKNEQ
jgi:hypothetical protein